MEPLDFFGQPATAPYMIGWMPTASVFFNDPDGHLLEYLTMLAHELRPNAGIRRAELVEFKRVATECTATDPGGVVARESSRLVLRRAFRHLEREIPTSVTRVLRWLRHPRSRWVRIPAGILFILGGFLAILPVFGAWMVPVGLLLLAADVPFLRRPIGHGTIWATERWRGAKGWYHRRSKRS